MKKEIKDESRITRRKFIKSTGGALALTSIGPGPLMNLAKAAEDDDLNEKMAMPKREYGKTGEQLSIIGFGGIVVDAVEQPIANESVSKAIDSGINYFDVAPTYGIAEERLGPALKPYRKDAFLACKTGKRDKEGAAAELRESLKKLETDHFDLYQLHAMSKEEDIEKVMGPGGAMEAFTEARDQGLVRYLGFSAHSAEVALALMDQFDFDSILFPINWVCYFNGKFGPKVIEKAQEKEMGILALKAMAKTNIKKGEEKQFKKCWYHPVAEMEETKLALRFTLSEPITAAIPPGDPVLFQRAVDLAPKLQPISQEERNMLEQLAKDIQPIFKARNA